LPQSSACRCITSHWRRPSVISDSGSKYIVVAAGPGSGKTRVLVHKLASLMLLEDAKHEQLLMLTFSRAAATEFKKRLMTLIGNAANFIEIKTFHSYCFDLLGKIGSLDGAADVVKKAVHMIESGEVEPGRIAKTVLVIDEAQDMDSDEYALIRALMKRNEDMRVIAVGDDDQNIYEFRGSNSKYMRSLVNEYGAKQYELIENYRSRGNIVALANELVKSIKYRMKTAPIQAVSKDAGTVKIIHHASASLEEPVVNSVIETYREGTACVLTATNDEALRVAYLLNKRGIRTRLIQSLDGFRLSDLAEIRYFLKKIDSRLQTSVIAEELWEYARSELKRAYSGSSCLENCLNMIEDFKQTKGYTIYRTDLEEFIRESQYEDFYSNDLGAVFVSTIHKAKGREFDSVYMLLNNIKVNTDEELRKLYVGITRTKKELFIHCNNFFGNCNDDGMINIYDTNFYSSPDEIALQLTHRDVVLDFFKDKKSGILKLRSGMPLAIDGNYLTADIDGITIRVAKFSKKFVRDLERFKAKGYSPTRAEVRFIVAWKCENDERECAVLLADVFLCRRRDDKDRYV
ncbi:MAG: ATP-dependent helicase, partial [Oscillospiraceae bacterium]|nr:ATP-dependent helicase [Oscillospiraceae bacterium]